jgi:predicted nucleic acid-binding protein
VSDRATVVAIDANVILRYLVGDGGRLADKAAGILEAVADGHAAVCCDPVTLAETVWVLRSYYELPNRAIESSLIPLVECPGFHVPNKSRYLTALKLLAEEDASFGDACVCALALQECEGRLYSFARKLSAIDDIDRAEALRKGK